jgi:hypothetical protein
MNVQDDIDRWAQGNSLQKTQSPADACVPLRTGNEKVANIRRRHNHAYQYCTQIGMLDVSMHVMQSPRAVVHLIVQYARGRACLQGAVRPFSAARQLPVNVVPIIHSPVHSGWHV